MEALGELILWEERSESANSNEGVTSTRKRRLRPRWALRRDKGGECGTTADTDLYDLLAVEHVRHHVSQFFQVIQDGVVG